MLGKLNNSVDSAIVLLQWTIWRTMTRYLYTIVDIKALGKYWENKSKMEITTADLAAMPAVGYTSMPIVPFISSN